MVSLQINEVLLHGSLVPKLRLCLVDEVLRKALVSPLLSAESCVLRRALLGKSHSLSHLLTYTLQLETGAGIISHRSIKLNIQFDRAHIRFFSPRKMLHGGARSWDA